MKKSKYEDIIRKTRESAKKMIRQEKNELRRFADQENQHVCLRGIK